MATAKKETSVITIPAIDLRTATITLKGDTPLIMHKWSEKAKKMMPDKQMLRRQESKWKFWKELVV